MAAKDVAGMAMANVVDSENAEKAVDRLFSIPSAHGLYENDAFRRNYRDVRFRTLVAGIAPDQAGKHVFDIPEDVQPR